MRLIIVFILLTETIFAINTDSLKSVINSNVSVQNKVDALNALGWELRMKNPDSTVALLSSSISMAYKAGYQKGLALALNNYGCSVMLYGMFQAANDSLDKAIEIYKSLGEDVEVGKALVNKAINYYYQSLPDSAIILAKQALGYLAADTVRLAATHLNIGLFYRSAGKLREAITHYLKALDLYEKIGNCDLTAATQNNIATLFYYLEKYDKAIEYSIYGLNTAKKCNSVREIGSAYFVRGISYGKIKLLDSAEYYLRESVKKFKDPAYKREQNNALFSLAEIYYETGRYNMALPIYDSIMDYFKAINDIKAYSSCLNGIGLIYYSQGKNDSAYKYLSQSYENLSYIEDPYFYKTVLKSFADLTEKMGDKDKALFLHKLYEQVKDSLYKEEVARQTAEIEAKYRLNELL